MFLNTGESKKPQTNDTNRVKKDETINVKEDLCKNNQVTKVTSPINTLSQIHNDPTIDMSGSGSYSRQLQPTVSSTNDDHVSENKIKMESKLLTIWHNVKYGKYK